MGRYRPRRGDGQPFRFGRAVAARKLAHDCIATQARAWPARRHPAPSTIPSSPAVTARSAEQSRARWLCLSISPILRTHARPAIGDKRVSDQRPDACFRSGLRHRPDDRFATPAPVQGGAAALALSPKAGRTNRRSRRAARYLLSPGFERPVHTCFPGTGGGTGGVPTSASGRSPSSMPWWSIRDWSPRMRSLSDRNVVASGAGRRANTIQGW